MGSVWSLACVNARPELLRVEFQCFRSARLNQIDGWMKEHSRRLRGRTNWAMEKQDYFRLLREQIPKAQLQKQWDALDTDFNGKIDALEIFTIFIVISRGSVSEKAQVCFDLYDFDGSASLKKAEVSLLINSAFRGLSKVCKGRVPRATIVKKTIEEVFENVPYQEQWITLQDFTSWCRTSEGVLALLQRFHLTRTPNHNSQESCRVSLETIGQRQKSLGRMSAEWIEGVDGGFKSADNPQFGIVFHTSKHSRKHNNIAKTHKISIIVERTDSSAKEGFAAFLVSSRAPLGHRLMNLSHHTIVAASDYLVSNRVSIENVQVSSAPKHYILLPCLQHRGHKGAFTFTIKCRPNVRAVIRQLPLVKTRMRMDWVKELSGGHGSASNPQIRLRLPRGLHLTRIELIESLLPMDETIALQVYDYEREEADPGSGRLLQLDDDALADTLPSRASRIELGNIGIRGCPKEYVLVPSRSGSFSSRGLELVVSTASGVAAELIENLPFFRGSVIGRWSAMNPQVLLQLIASEDSERSVQIAVLRTDGGPKQALVLRVFECDEGARLLSLPQTPSFKSGVIVSDSVSLNCTLNTNKFYVVVPCLERQTGAVGRFVLTATLIRGTARSRSRSRSRSHNNTEQEQTSLRLRILPEPSLNCIELSTSKKAGLHVDSEQIQLIPSSEGNVHLELHRVGPFSDDDVVSIGFAIYRGRKGVFDVRKKCLFDADLLSTTASTTSDSVSLNVCLVPEDCPYILLPFTSSNTTKTCKLKLRMSSLSPLEACLLPASAATLVPLSTHFQIPQTCSDGVERKQEIRFQQGPGADFDMEHIISYCESEEGNFLDDSFPPTICSLVGAAEPGEEEKQFASNYGVVGWSRLSDICDEAQVFPEHISSDDIIEACASHTWLIQAVSSLSTRMEMLRSLITPSKPSSSGLYSVRLFNKRSGSWDHILLDDYVPVDSNRRPCFARCHDPNIIWIMLLEKAFAKLHGSYRHMSQSESSCIGLTDGLTALTGVQAIGLDLSLITREQLWSELCQNTNRSWVTACSIAPGHYDPHDDLPWNRGYTVSDVKEVDGHRLVVVRCNWGQQVQWTGEWSKNSKSWEGARGKNLKTEFGYKEADAMSFFISLNDFREVFSTVSLCRFVGDPFEYHDIQRDAWSSSLHCDGVGRRAWNPQYQFCVGSGALSLCLSISSYQRRQRPKQPLNLMLCRVSNSTALPLARINKNDVIASSGLSLKSFVRLELNLPKSVSGMAFSYIIIPSFGDQDTIEEAAFTLTMKCTHRCFLSRLSCANIESVIEILGRQPKQTLED